MSDYRFYPEFDGEALDRWLTTNPDERFDVSEDELQHFTCMEPDRWEEDQ